MTRPAPSKSEGRRRAVDPVCGEVFDPALATFTSRWEGRTVGFCSETCKDEFDTDPDGYPILSADEEE